MGRKCTEMRARGAVGVERRTDGAGSFSIDFLLFSSCWLLFLTAAVIIPFFIIPFFIIYWDFGSIDPIPWLD